MSVMYICCSFVAKRGYCFIDQMRKGYPEWRRSRTDIAIKRWPNRIIRCSVRKCKEPATILDHYYPYHSEMNRCKKHEEVK